MDSSNADEQDHGNGLTPTSHTESKIKMLNSRYQQRRTVATNIRNNFCLQLRDLLKKHILLKTALSIDDILFSCNQYDLKHITHDVLHEALNILRSVIDNDSNTYPGPVTVSDIPVDERQLALEQQKMVTNFALTPAGEQAEAHHVSTEYNKSKTYFPDQSKNKKALTLILTDGRNMEFRFCVENISSTLQEKLFGRHVNICTWKADAVMISQVLAKLPRYLMRGSGSLSGTDIVDLMLVGTKTSATVQHHDSPRPKVRNIEAVGEAMPPSTDDIEHPYISLPNDTQNWPLDNFNQTATRIHAPEIQESCQIIKDPQINDQCQVLHNKFPNKACLMQDGKGKPSRLVSYQAFSPCNTVTIGIPEINSQEPEEDMKKYFLSPIPGEVGKEQISPSIPKTTIKTGRTDENRIRKFDRIPQCRSTEATHRYEKKLFMPIKTIRKSQNAKFSLSRSMIMGTSLLQFGKYGLFKLTETHNATSVNMRNPQLPSGQPQAAAIVPRNQDDLDIPAELDVIDNVQQVDQPQDADDVPGVALNINDVEQVYPPLEFNENNDIDRLSERIHNGNLPDVVKDAEYAIGYISNRNGRN